MPKGIIWKEIGREIVDCIFGAHIFVLFKKRMQEAEFYKDYTIKYVLSILATTLRLERFLQSEKITKC